MSTCADHVEDATQNDGLAWRSFIRFEARLLRAIEMQDNVAVGACVVDFRRDAERSVYQGQAFRTLIKLLIFKIEGMLVMEDRDPDAVLCAIDAASCQDEILSLLQEHCLSVCSAVRVHRKCRRRQLLEEVRSDIDDHFREEDYGLNAAALQIGISPNYLSGMFKKEFGQGIHEYITAKRIEQARELLIHTEENVGEIGARVGYVNPYHFSANFKKYTGMCPTEYRELNKK